MGGRAWGQGRGGAAPPGVGGTGKALWGNLCPGGLGRVWVCNSPPWPWVGWAGGLEQTGPRSLLKWNIKLFFAMSGLAQLV